MNRRSQQFIALLLSVAAFVGGYLLQPDNLVIFSNPKVAAVFLGLLVGVIPILNNALPSLWKSDPPAPTVTGTTTTVTTTEPATND